jgi:Ring finger domain
MATRISSLFTFGARHERLPTEDGAATRQTSTDEEEAVARPSRDESNNNNSRSNDSSSDTVIAVETVESDDDEETGGGPTEEDSGVIANDDEEEDNAAAQLTATIPRLSTRGTVSLAELEEERELARRRTSACVLLAVFVLFRLWVVALQSGDVFYMILCLFGTSWTARLIRHNREREEALDERIRVYLENAGPDPPGIDRNELRFLSFQAQLALAMMESQRQMQQGGYGHPDGHNGSNGVSDDAKKKWDVFAFKEGMEGGVAAKLKGGYGSVTQEEHAKGLEEDGPHCSICLGEYEDGEKLVRLPCGHIYHEDCVSSWTTNHTRCPLCNYDLESATSESSSPPENSMV